MGWDSNPSENCLCVRPRRLLRDPLFAGYRVRAGSSLEHAHKTNASNGACRIHRDEIG